MSRAAPRLSLRPLTITCTGIDQFIDCSTPSSDCGNTNTAKHSIRMDTHSANVTRRPTLIDGIDSWHGSSVVRRAHAQTHIAMNHSCWASGWDPDQESAGVVNSTTQISCCDTYPFHVQTPEVNLPDTSLRATQSAQYMQVRECQ